MAYNPNEKYNLLELLQKADNGEPEAMETAVALLAAEEYLDDPDIYERYLSYLHALAEIKKTVACIMLGDAYACGNGVPVDPDKAISYYQAAAEAGEAFGNECIGLLYYSGTVVPTDYEKAFHYFMKGQKHKSFCTLYSLGEMYRQGLYVERNLVTACKYFSEIVYSDETSPEVDDYYWCACYRLGHALHVGEGMVIDPDAAYELLSKAKSLAEKRGENTRDAGITYDEVFEEWAEMRRDLDLL